MFSPSRDQVRRFFIETWHKYRCGAPLAGLEALALDIVRLHPEYHSLLDRPPEALEGDFTPESGQMNPFLHLSLHLAIEEQLSIDQPKGICAQFQRIAEKTGDRHAALHAALECLGEMLWRAQRIGSPPDGDGYLEGLKRH